MDTDPVGRSGGNRGDGIPDSGAVRKGDQGGDGFLRIERIENVTEQFVFASEHSGRRLSWKARSDP